MSTTVLGGQVDIPAFITSILTGSVFTVSGTAVPVFNVYPQFAQTPSGQITIPSVAIEKTHEDYEWISIPAVRRRHYSYVSTYLYATNMPDRFSMLVSARSAINSFAVQVSTYSTYPNYVWVQIDNEDNEYDPDMVPPTYYVVYDILTIWDEVLPNPPLIHA